MHSNVFHHNSVLPCRICVRVCVTFTQPPPFLPQPSCIFSFSCICSSSSSSRSRKLNPIRVDAVYAVWVLVSVFIFASFQLYMHIAWASYLNNSCVAMHKSDRTELLIASHLAPNPHKNHIPTHRTHPDCSCCGCSGLIHLIFGAE